MNSKIRIDMESLSDLGNDLTEIRYALRYYKEKCAILSFDGTELQPVFLLQFLEYIIIIQKEKLKKNQQQGINLALQRKYEGDGSYGRPKIVLPNGFNDRIRDCFENHHPLSDYYNEVNMKKSTFYKYARREHERMRAEDKRKK
ncbi:recombinase family protein [[Clostridium] innocuum]|nr:recombinase family protein [[Clostridium] innocuum]